MCIFDEQTLTEMENNDSKVERAWVKMEKNGDRGEKLWMKVEDNDSNKNVSEN